MKFIARQKYAKHTPQKLREVVAMIKGLSPEQAIARLPFTQKFAAEVLSKTIKSAAAQAVQKGVEIGDLKIEEIQINEGPRLKRGRPVSKGRWHPILKRMSHIRVVLVSEEKPKVDKTEVKKSQKQVRSTQRAKSVRDDKARLESLRASSKASAKRKEKAKAKK